MFMFRQNSEAKNLFQRFGLKMNNLSISVEDGSVGSVTARDPD
jgi:hypothetical protein